MKRTVFLLMYARQLFYFPDFPITPTGSGPIRSSKFFNRNARCDSGNHCQHCQSGWVLGTYSWRHLVYEGSRDTNCDSTGVLQSFTQPHGGQMLRFPTVPCCSEFAMSYGAQKERSLRLKPLCAPGSPNHKFRKLHSVKLSPSLSTLVT